jgi:hypothetical protein
MSLLWKILEEGRQGMHKFYLELKERNHLTENHGTRHHKKNGGGECSPFHDHLPEFTKRKWPIDESTDKEAISDSDTRRFSRSKIPL